MSLHETVWGGLQAADPNSAGSSPPLEFGHFDMAELLPPHFFLDNPPLIL